MVLLIACPREKQKKYFNNIQILCKKNSIDMYPRKKEGRVKNARSYNKPIFLKKKENES